MDELGVVPALVRLLTAEVAPKGSSGGGESKAGGGGGGQPADRLVLSVLMVLFNLSFDTSCREQMVKAGLIPKLVEMLAQGRNRRAILLLLYHLSSEERIRKLFTYTEAIPIVMQMVINFPVRRQLSVVTVLCVCVCFVVEVNYFYITLLTILLIIL